MCWTRKVLRETNKKESKALDLENPNYRIGGEILDFSQVSVSTNNYINCQITQSKQEEESQK